MNMNPSGGQVADAQNPRALAYARQRLAQAQAQGYVNPNFHSADPTQWWRNYSQQHGAQQATTQGMQTFHQQEQPAPPLGQLHQQGATDLNALAQNYSPPPGFDPAQVVANTKNPNFSNRSALAARFARQLLGLQ